MKQQIILKTLAVITRFLTIALLSSMASFCQIDMLNSTAHVIPYWVKGESQSYSVTVEKFQLNKSDTISKNELSYDLDITVLDETENSYVLEWRNYNFQSSETNPVIHKFSNSTENMKIIVQTNELGMYADILNSDDHSIRYGQS